VSTRDESSCSNDPADAELLNAARDARGRAHAPYSNFTVGAAVRTASGRVVLGCNVESATYGLTVCAERVALYAALSDGETDFAAVAVVVPDGRRAVPCGICRQMLSEFAPNARLILANGDGSHRVTMVGDLLPAAAARDDDVG